MFIVPELRIVRINVNMEIGKSCCENYLIKDERGWI